MMRDSEKEKSYFDYNIVDLYSRLNKRHKKIDNGLIKSDRISAVKNSMSLQYLNIIKLKYSRGDILFSEEVVQEYCLSISLLSEASLIDKGRHLLSYIDNGKPIFLNQYTLQFHFDIMDMLCLGVLLDIPNVYFILLSKKIDEDKVKDFLFEFLIKHKIEDRIIISEENFKEFPWYKDRFFKIKELLRFDDKEIIQKKLKNFLENDWYNSLQDTSGYNQHKKDYGNYIGYWCFVAAAIVKIKKLDDSSFRDNKYYPKDILI